MAILEIKEGYEVVRKYKCYLYIPNKVQNSVWTTKFRKELEYLYMLPLGTVLASHIKLIKKIDSRKED